MDTLKFDEPGDYVITPHDYKYNDKIIVELWNGGEGGVYTNEHRYFGRGFAYGHNTISAGKSGAYKKICVHTYQENINIHVGFGLDSTLNSRNQNDIEKTYSTISSKKYDKLEEVDGCNGVSVNAHFDGTNGNYIYNYTGGNAYKGGYGASITSYGIRNPRNYYNSHIGQSPGGGGVGHHSKTTIWKDGWTKEIDVYGKGGDGAVHVHFINMTPKELIDLARRNVILKNENDQIEKQ